MKKLTIIAIIALSATLAKAAAVAWTFTGATADQVGWNVYLVSSIGDDWTGIADVASAAAELGSGTTGTVAKNGRSYSVAQRSASGAGITADAMGEVFFVLVKSADATDYTYIKANLSSMVYEPPATPSSVYSTAIATLAGGTSGSFSTSPDPAAPEPTSGLLLLLGVAGLALRRRQK